MVCYLRPKAVVVGGLPAKPKIASMTAEALVGRARHAVAEKSGHWRLLGPDCSINPDMPEPLMEAVGEAVRAAR